jgi:hypothetical protein
MTTTKKVIIVAVTVAVLGGLGYWAYKYYGKKSLEDSSPDTKGTNDNSNPPVPTDATTNAPVKVTDSIPTGESIGRRDLVITNTSTKLTNEDLNFIVRVFQNWMDKNHPNWVKMANGTMGNLNGKSTLGYGNFGPQTKTNLKKYKNEFISFLMSITLFGIKNNRGAVVQFFNYASQFGI